MAIDALSRIIVRDAVEADIPALVAVKGAGTEALHYDRLHEAQGTGFRYLVLIVDHVLIGMVCFFTQHPASWSDADDSHRLPFIVDLQVKASHREQGYGSVFIRSIEHIAATSGYQNLYLNVEPEDNPRADAIYQRHGYQPIKTQPYHKNWAVTNSAGIIHQGKEWLVDMVKA